MDKHCEGSCSVSCFKSWVLSVGVVFLECTLYLSIVACELLILCVRRKYNDEVQMTMRAFLLPMGMAVPYTWTRVV